MKLISMTATFGCLDQAHLELHHGLNRLVLPNEQGKSTWCAFLLAMFYGIDTAQRAARGRLPEKQRYAPWNGKPMEGLVELEHQGRVVVLQRTSTRGRPMGEFRAWDKATGRDIPGLTGENCGLRLLGVERPVYQRSGFLRGEELTVTQNQDLARRLENLAAAGQTGDNYPQAEARLKQWQNRIRYHNTGLLPEAQERHRQLLQTQLLRRELAQELEQLTARQAELTRQQGQLPSRQLLQQLLGQLDAMEDAPTAPEPPCPAALAGLTAEAIWPQATKDAERYDRLTASAAPRPWFLLGLAAVAAALALWPVAAWGVGALMLLAGVIWAKKYRQVQKNLTQSKEILQAYDAVDRQSLLDAALARRDWLLEQETAHRRNWQRSVAEQQLAELTADPRGDLARHEQIDSRLRELEREALTVQARLDTLASPEEDLRRLEAQIEELKQREAAIVAARQALAQAQEQLSRVYAPRLTGAAGTVLAALTGGRYDAMVLDQELCLSVREASSGLLRPVAALSSGARDQAWLALRLAMTELLLPGDAPIVLDDALVCFDRQREAAALELLDGLHRQVVVFACR